MVNAWCPNCRVELTNGSCDQCGYRPGAFQQRRSRRREPPPDIDPDSVPNRYQRELDRLLEANPHWVKGEDESPEAYRARMSQEFRRLMRKVNEAETKTMADKPRMDKTAVETGPLKPTLRIGGLFRCCTDSFDVYYADGTLERAEVGDSVQCLHVPSDPVHRMIQVERNVWEWVDAERVRQESAQRGDDWPKRDR